MLQLYRGDLSPKDSWDILSSESKSFLIDVRTKAECYYVGRPDLSSLTSSIFLEIEWRSLPNMMLNSDFVSELLKHVSDQSTNLLFICRTGGRSREAANAMANLGFKNCFNILHGFDGDLDHEYHRSIISGWKADGLPWRQD